MGRLVEKKTQEKGINVMASIDLNAEDAQSKEIAEKGDYYVGSSLREEGAHCLYHAKPP